MKTAVIVDIFTCKPILQENVMSPSLKWIYLFIYNIWPKPGNTQWCKSAEKPKMDKHVYPFPLFTLDYQSVDIPWHSVSKFRKKKIMVYWLFYRQSRLQNLVDN